MFSSREASVAVPQDDFMDIDEQVHPEPRRPLSQLSSAGNHNPLSLLDPTIGRDIFGSHPDSANQAQFVSHTREVREIPVEVKDGNHNTPQSSHAPTIEDVTGTVHAHGSDTHGAIIIDDDNDAPSVHFSNQDEQSNKMLADTSLGGSARPSAPEFESLPEYSNDIEEEMIRAAIEASKRDAEEKYPDYEIGRQHVHLSLGWI